MMTRDRTPQAKPKPISRNETEEVFHHWLVKQEHQRRAGDRTFHLTMNSNGEVMAIKGIVRERLA